MQTHSQSGNVKSKAAAATASNVEDAAVDAKDRLMNGVASAAAQVGDLGDKVLRQGYVARDVLVSRGSEYLRQAEAIVRKRPLTAIAVAAGAGIAAVALAMGKRSRK